MKTQKQISAAVVYRISDKSGKCLGYLVPSDTEGQEPYEVTYNYTLHRYECNCKCGIECNHTKECKHIRAVIEVVEARKEVATPADDVVGPALTVVNRAMADAKIGTCYDDMAGEKAQRIEAVREQTREEHEQEDRAYRHEQIMQAMAERKCDAMGYRHEWYPRTSL